MKKNPTHGRSSSAIFTGFSLFLLTFTLHSSAQQISFKKHTLLTEFASEGIAVGDVNNDGKKDILAGAYWFEAPDWQKHELDSVRAFPVKRGYSNSMLNFVLDVNNDGWLDLIRIDFPGTGGYWHENPQGKDELWKIHTIYDQVGNESPHFVDIDGDGREDLLFGDPDTNEVVWMRAPTQKGETDWEKFVIGKPDAEEDIIYAHGMGYGDVNNDGRNDVITIHGWWEGPAADVEENWTFHAADLGEACAQMYALDIDQDGDNDIISSSAHYSGFWWYEQGRDNQNNETWTTHLISQTTAETHALSVADINGDGKPDFVTGNRYFAHNSEDPADHGPAVLTWYEFMPDKKPNPKWTAYPIDADSGVGINIVTEDITDDGLVDIMVANKKGIFIFVQQGSIEN